MFGLTVTTEPTAEPVSLPEAKAHLAVYHDQDDALIQSLITAARRYCETATKRAFVTQTLRLTRDAFPGACEGWMFRLPRPPLASVSSVKYTDDDGVEQTVSSSSYVVDTTSVPGRVALADGYDWPTDVANQIAAVQVNYVAGQAVASVPQTIKAAIKLLMGHWYANREAVGPSMSAAPLAVESLLMVEWSGELVGDFG